MSQAEALIVPDAEYRFERLFWVKNPLNIANAGLILSLLIQQFLIFEYFCIYSISLGAGWRFLE